MGLTDNGAELTNWNLPDSQLCLEAKTELIVAKSTKAYGGGTAQKKLILGGGTLHIVCLWGKQFGWGHSTTLKEKSMTRVSGWGCQI